MIDPQRVEFAFPTTWDVHVLTYSIRHAPKFDIASQWILPLIRSR